MENLLLTIAVLIGVAGAVFLVARSPAFWIDFGAEVFRGILPDLLKVSEETKKRNEKETREGTNSLNKRDR